MSLDPVAEAVLRDRWSRSQRHLMLFSIVWPALSTLSCGVTIVLALQADAGIAWYAVLPPIASAIAAVVLRLWYVRGAPLEPASWLHAAFLTAGAQLMLGAIPSYGIAMHMTAGVPGAAATVLFALCWACAVAMCISARRANRILLMPLVPEPGSADGRIALDVRCATTSHDLVSARMVVDHDRVEWSARLHRGRRGGPRADMSVSFGELHEVTPVDLPALPAWRPWITLDDGTALSAQAGPAVILTTARGDWLIPVRDSGLVTELINCRKELWNAEGD